MRIDGANGAQPQGLPAGEPPLPKSSRPAPGGAHPASDDATIGPADKPYVRTAMASQEVDRAAVAEASKLLLEGKLDTPAAARRAAEAILDRGP